MSTSPYASVLCSVPAMPQRRSLHVLEQPLDPRDCLGRQRVERRAHQVRRPPIRHHDPLHANLHFQQRRLGISLIRRREQSDRQHAPARHKNRREDPHAAGTEVHDVHVQPAVTHARGRRQLDRLAPCTGATRILEGITTSCRVDRRIASSWFPLMPRVSENVNSTVGPPRWESPLGPAHVGRFGYRIECDLSLAPPRMGAAPPRRPRDLHTALITARFSDLPYPANASTRLHLALQLITFITAVT